MNTRRTFLKAIAAIPLAACAGGAVIPPKPKAIDNDPFDNPPIADGHVTSFLRYAGEDHNTFGIDCWLKPKTASAVDVQAAADFMDTLIGAWIARYGSEIKSVHIEYPQVGDGIIRFVGRGVLGRANS